MHGLVFEIFEEWVVQMHGLKAWHTIKQQAGCDVMDKSFVTRTFYNYDIWLKLITATAEEIGSSFDGILESYGHFNIRYHFSHGHDALLRCQGSTLRQWLSNLNAMHDHVQKSFPGENFCPPVFWCEDCDTVDGSILLHYFSQRGNVLAPWVVGIVEELASSHFEVEVKMHRLAKQDEDGSKFTTWRITAVDESQQWKLSPKANGQSCDGEEDAVSFDGVQLPSKCPFTGNKLKKDIDESEEMCPHTVSSSDSDEVKDQEGLSLAKMREVFPFHVLVNNDFEIVQVGDKLPKLLERKSTEFKGVHIKDVLQITRPVLGTDWNWRSLNKLSDQNFFLAPTTQEDKLSRTASIATGHQTFSIAESAIKFKASIVDLSSDKVMFTLSPEARNVDDLNNMGLTLSDLPLQSCQRDAVFLGEYITQEADKAHNLDKLSRTLGAEQVRYLVWFIFVSHELV
jgi:guanylate cyclase soluble subunit beta